MASPLEPARPADDPPWADAIDASHARRTVIFAPTGNDARLTADFLGVAGIASVCVGSVEELCNCVTEGCGAVVLAEEALNPTAALRFFALLRRQPPWSDLPVTLITTGGATGNARTRRLASLGLQNNVAVLERPFRPATLVSALKVALRSRDRQYEVRKLLGEIGEARDVAERASRAKDDFLAALSHELRTPLNPVLLLATENAGNPELPSAIREDFELIARNTTLEARLIDDLLDLTRITQGKLSLSLTTVDAHAAIRAAIETTRVEMAEKQLRIELALRASPAAVRGDPVRVQQVLWNVLKNAAKFTAPGGQVGVTTEIEREQLVIRIADSGVGMNRDELARVFSPFVQGNHANVGSGHRFGGLGLGLAISRRLMELHAGSIDASSEGPGQGTTFTIRFPLAAADDVTAAPATGPGVSRPPFTPGSRRLLLIEDHPPTRVSLQRLLERRGYQVEAVGSIAEARAALARGNFELVLSDLGLPDGSGHELMSELRGRPGVRGIALSGYGMEADVARSREMGFSAHLTKPITIQALDAALATMDAPAGGAEPAGD